MGSAAPGSGPGQGREPLAVESLTGATVMPATPYAHPRRQTAFRMGVFDDRGRIVRGSLLQRSYGQVGFAADFPSATRSDQRSVVFAGHLSHHFGHFILESLSRLWYARERPESPIVWACRPEPIPPAWHDWQRQILDVLGIRNEVLLLTEPTRFRSVDIPQPGYRVKDFFARQHADFLAAYPARARDPDLRVWLSRSGTASEYHSLHAVRLEQQLAEHGWTIVQPDTLPISEQLELMATARRVAGEQGSAFHLVVLLGDVRGLEVDVICRDPSRPVEEQNQNYPLIADVRGLRQRLHVIPEERVLATRGGNVRKVATTLAGHLEALGIPRAEGSAAAPRSRGLTRLVNAVAARVSAQSYLEVGPGDVDADPDVDVDTRHIVRPAYPTDPRRPQPAGQSLFEMPADDFFRCCADAGRPYDIVLIDGFASAEQAGACVVAARAVAGPRTVWLLRGAGSADLLPGLRQASLDPGDGPCVVVLSEHVRLDLSELADALGAAP